MGSRVGAGEQAVSGRRACRGSGVALLKLHTPGSEAVKVGCGDTCCAVTPYISETEVICLHDDNVGMLHLIGHISDSILETER